jgi:hypothetical protein
MHFKLHLTIFCCLILPTGFGEEIFKLPENISAAASEADQYDIPQEETFVESGIITIQPEPSKSEIVFPIEESNFEEVFGRHR